MSVLGTLNGVGTGFSALGRGLFPALIGAAFSWGIEKGGSVVPAWWLLAALALLSIIPGYYIVEQDGPSRGDDVEEETHTQCVLYLVLVCRCSGLSGLCVYVPGYLYLVTCTC